MSEQTISALTAEDEQRLDQHRSVVTRYLDDDGLQKYQTAAWKLGTLRALLEANVVAPDQTYELQSMGIVLSDVFVQNMGFHWVIVEVDYGRDPSILYEETSVLIFPLTMISKRVERKETVDVFELYNGVAAQVSELILREQSQ